MSRSKKGEGRNYGRDLKRTLRGCVIDALIWGGITLLFAGAALLTWYGELPEDLVRYRLSLLLICCTAALAALIKGLQSLAEITSIKDVISRSVYAVMLTQKQQNRIFRSVGRQSFLEHLTYFLFGAVPVTGIMLWLYYNTGDTSSLFAMGILDGFLLFGTLLAYGLDVGRLASRDGFCTVSDMGIITANEILPFSAKDGDVLKMIEFDDVYEVIFRRKCYMGITRKYTFPLPKSGTLSKGLEDRELEEVLLETFGLVDDVDRGGEYTETRGEDLALTERDEPADASAENISALEDVLTGEDGDVPAAAEDGELFSGIAEDILPEPEEKVLPEETVLPEVPEEEPDRVAALDEETPSLVIAPEETGTEEEEAPPEEVLKGEDTAPEDTDTELEETVSVLYKDEENDVPKSRLKETLSGAAGSRLRKAAAVMAAVLLIAVCAVLLRGRGSTPSTDPVPGNSGGQVTPSPSKQDDPSGQSGDEPFVDELPRSELTQGEDGVWSATIGGETIVIVNKEKPLPENYGGVNEIAMNAFSRMLEDAEEQGIHLSFVSGYISYAQQKSMYESRVAQMGEAAAELVVNPPGTSEHQLGVAFDVNVTDSDETLLSTEFAETEEYEWLLEHCAEYGFILRYPNGKKDITGFGFEPWHYRYVGREVAEAIMDAGVTLEEYLEG